MSDSATVFGVVVFVIVVLTVVFCVWKTHKRVFDHIERKQDRRNDAQESREQRYHERDMARLKRQHEREDHEHHISQRTSAHTQPHNEHHETQAKADARHAEIVDLLKGHHAAPHREESVFHPSAGVGHAPSPHPTVWGSVHASQVAPHHSFTHGATFSGHAIEIPGSRRVVASWHH